jgi:endonuclease/exonuclease/phosphatase family metal-dependent hydrolase
LAATAPDVIALQELDVSRGRSGLVDQAQQIAKALEMELHFHPSFQIEEERYGNAVLSRLPMKLVQAGPLPHDGRVREPRGALWVEISVSKTRLQFLTTHLGTAPAERVAQVEDLLSANWLDHPDCHGPVILCGDFNAMPGSRAYRQVTSRLRDAQLILERHRPRRTWFAPLPLTRIDHVFVNDHLEVKRIDVPRTQLSRFASDHLPLVVDVEVIPSAALTNPLGTKPAASSQEVDRTPDGDPLEL